MPYLTVWFLTLCVPTTRVKFVQDSDSYRFRKSRAVIDRASGGEAVLNLCAFFLFVSAPLTTTTVKNN